MSQLFSVFVAREIKQIQKAYFFGTPCRDGRQPWMDQPLTENNFGWKTALDGKDSLGWKIRSLDGRQPWIETTLDGR